MSSEIKYYPMTESHKLLLQAEALTGKTYNNLCIMINFEQDDIDPSVMEEAINKSILRFPSTYVRRHDVKEGKKKVAKQYFVEMPESKCISISFKDDKKMYKYIDKFVKKPFPHDYQDCDLYKVNLLQRANGRYSLLICMYHLIADAYGIIRFVEDVINVYKALKHNTEMPKPFEPLLPAYQIEWDYETSERHAKDIEFWRDFLDSVPAPQYATINGFHDKYAYIPGKKYGNYLNIFNFKAKQTNYRISKELNERVETFAKQNKFSAKIIYLIALRTWLSKQTDKTEEFYVLDLMANRSKKIVANTGGSFASNIHFYFNAKNSMTFLEACKYTSVCQYKYMRHGKAYDREVGDLIAKKVNLDKKFENGWVRGTSALLFTYQPYFAAKDNEMKMSIERFSTGKSPMPMYITIMPTDTYSGEMNVNYEYMTKNHSEENIAEFHKFLLKFIDKATSNPNMTLNELMEV